MPHAIALSNFSKFFVKILFSLFSLGPLDPLTQHAIALNNNCFVIFVKSIIFLSFVDHLRLFGFFFVTFVTECNPEHIS